MAYIISVVNQKGGVGKTTTSVNLAAFLASLGLSVLLVDMDPQGNASTSFAISLDPEKDLSVYDLLIDNVAVDEVLQKTNVENLDILASTVNLAGASVELVNLQDREYRLKQKLDQVKDRYNFIILDCPPSLGLLTINALVASNYVLIPVQAEYYALEGLGQLVKTLDLVKKYLQPDLEILGAVLTMYDKRNKLSRDIRYDLEDNFPYNVFETVIPRNVRLSEAPSYGQTILDYASDSKGAQAYKWLAKEIVKYLIEKEENKNNN